MIKRLIALSAIPLICAHVSLATEPIEWSHLDNGNDHWYQVVTVPGGIDWTDANAMATGMILHGNAGHLVTITSEAENNWIHQHLTMGDVWIGAIQSPDSSEPADGWEWITGEPWTVEFWCSGEPANTGGAEDHATITYSWPRCPGAWNDANQFDTCSGFLVEWSLDSSPSVDAIQWEAAEGGNDHWYQVVTVDGNIDWNEARSAAEAVFLFGQPGYLATVTSSEESAWILANLQMGDVWIGAVQPPGSPEPLGGWEWITGEPWTYDNWCSGEPANTGGQEDRVTITHSWPRCPGSWNDASQNDVCSGYIIEWGGAGTPVQSTSWGALKDLFRDE